MVKIALKTAREYLCMDRVVFYKHNQKEFMHSVCKNLSLKEFIRKHQLKIKYTTFRDYYSGKRSLPLDLFQALCKIGGRNQNNLDIKIKPKNWGAVEGGKRGIKTLFERYEGSLNVWRSKGGKISGLKPHNLKKIILPSKNDERLSELVGAYLGDGTFTNYFIRICGDKRYDLPYFQYLSNITSNMLGINTTIRAARSKNQLYFEIHSKSFCDFFKKIGLKTGDKIVNKTKIPKIFLKNQKLIKACIRGLIDTDGSVSKDGDSFSVRFTSHDDALLKQMHNITKLLDLFTFKTGQEIGTRSKSKIFNYFSKIGSSNLRHIVRFCEFANGNIIKKERVLEYYSKYKNVTIPFKLGL